jgi:hypothetical protein
MAHLSSLSLPLLASDNVVSTTVQATPVLLSTRQAHNVLRQAYFDIFLREYQFIVGDQNDGTKIPLIDTTSITCQANYIDVYRIFYDDVPADTFSDHLAWRASNSDFVTQMRQMWANLLQLCK